ncbi:hypothetical protein [Qipengyuania spongiae]|uniref:Uncharacterized protein n=1 Tax=Qipengyuania spongiae TaxID=2909673 RepID=A0ABY5SZJ3_9SPHN|nr:hypothetical protein [Qipengyuania spongiae]UVI39943.1 hypothetical protein L1F33_02995 [Qipengyuania spongiae]
MKPIAHDEFSSLIEPGLGCGFETRSGDLVFVASAPSDRKAVAEAVVKATTVPIVLEASRAGGYEALRNGGSFTNGMDFSVSIMRDPGEGRSGEIETTSWSASLTIRGEEGMERVYSDGTYTCGT